MGTLIFLEVGGVSIDWAKNGMGVDHGALFQEADRTRRALRGEDPASLDEGDHEPSVAEAAFVRPLQCVVPRLDLLGYTFERARAEYEARVRDMSDVQEQFDLERPASALMTFDEYCEFLCQFPILELDDTYIEYGTEGYDARARGRFAPFDAQIDRIPEGYDSSSYWSEKSYFGARCCVLSPYSMLQVLARCPCNHGVKVVWQYGPMVESGWVAEESYGAGAARAERVLIVTEGSTDSRILSRALELLRPDIADFFRFIDADLSHPFWGTGNLVRFAEGLLRIDVLNRILFVLDNDAEGMDALNRIRKLGLPPNIRCMTLPDHEALRAFPTVGPQGAFDSDINGRAAAIECYLDLRLDDYPPARVSWSNYKKDVDAWHGALEHKESYMRHFLEQTRESIFEGRYDVSKLEPVVNALVTEVTHLMQDDLDDNECDDA